MDSNSRMSSISTTLARQYGVTTKCIRDIWQGRTWPEATFHLWGRELQTSEDYHGKMEKVRIGPSDPTATPAPSANRR